MKKILVILFSFVCYAALSGQEHTLQYKIGDVPKLFGEKNDTLSIAIIGDVMMHSKQLEYDCKPFLSMIKEDLAGADIAIANMEFALGGEPYSGYPAFSTPDYYADYAAECGIDVFLTANNHITDKGSKGFRRTLQYYDNMELDGKIRYTGSGINEYDFLHRNPLFIQHKGIRVALVNFTYGTNSPESQDWPKVAREKHSELIEEALKRAKEGRADIIIALPHWGQEYILGHSSHQERTARWLAENGADIIVGAHPHVVQDTSIIHFQDKEIPVYYSLGNAVSNMSATNTQLEIMARINIIRTPDGDVFISETSYDWLWCSRPGGFTDNYVVLPVARMRNNPELWDNAADYKKMIATLKNVKEETGL